MEEQPREELPKVNEDEVPRYSPDMTVTIGPKSFQCFSCVLHNYCGMFAGKVWPGRNIRLPETKISASTFEMAYTWMVTPDSGCKRHKLLELLLAAQYLRAPKLMQTIFGALQDRRLFANVDALLCYAEAVTKGLDNVAELMLGRLGRCFLVVIADKEFFNLEAHEVCSFLSADCLAVHTELEVFYAALYWLLSDYQERKIHLPYVMQTVRFELMPLVELTVLYDKLQSLLPDCNDRMYLLLQLVVISGQQRIEQGTPQPRVYIRDPKCPYLHLLDDDGAANQLNEAVYAPIEGYIMSLENSFEEFLARITDVPKATDAGSGKGAEDEDENGDGTGGENGSADEDMDEDADADADEDEDEDEDEDADEDMDEDGTENAHEDADEEDDDENENQNIDVDEDEDADEDADEDDAEDENEDQNAGEDANENRAENADEDTDEDEDEEEDDDESTSEESSEGNDESNAEDTSTSDDDL